MKLNVNGWSIVHTADGKGLSLKPDDASANQYEVCVALRGGVLHLAIHEDGVDAPVLEIDQTLA